jgi:hypothetical protein
LDLNSLQRVGAIEASVNIPLHRIFNIQKKEIESSTFNQCDEFRAVSADLEVSSGVYANVSDGRNCGEDDVNTTAAAQSKIRRWHWLLSLLQRW